MKSRRVRWNIGELAEAGPSGNGRFALLAEDDEDIRGALITVLTQAGIDVYSVCSGYGFVELVGDLAQSWEGLPPEEVPDLIVTDVRMPGYDGLEVLEMVRDLGWSVPAIVVSAYGDAATKARARRITNTSFFDKPIDLDRFERAVLEAVR